MEILYLFLPLFLNFFVEVKLDANLIAVAVSIFTLLLMYVLMQKQISLAEKQTTLMQKQDEIINRKSNLTVEVKLKEDAFKIEILVKNIGNKGALDHYWHFYLPSGLKGKMYLVPHENEEEEIERTGENSFKDLGGFNYYKGNFEGKIYPSRSMIVCVFKSTNKIQEPTHLLWRLIGEDGIFPDGGHLGMIKNLENK